MKDRFRLPLIAPLMAMVAACARIQRQPRGLLLQEQQPGGDSNNNPAGGQPPQQPDRQPPRRPNQGPPDLDEIWNDLNRKLGRWFGGGGNRNNPGGNRNRNRLPNLPQPNMRGAGIGLAVVVILVIVIWLGSGIFIVKEGQQAVITRFGKYQTTVGAGMRWRLPWPIERNETENATLIRSVDVGGDGLVENTGLHESAMLTADENIVEIKFSVQYRLSDTRAFLFNTRDPADAVRKAAESAVREVVGQMTMDNAMADERDQIAPRVRKLMQGILDRYQVGVDVVAVNLQQSGVSPPEQVKAAFDDVLSAAQERERKKNQAQAYANRVVPQASGDKASVIAHAQGETQRFSAVLAEYEKAPQVTRDRLYIDTLRGVYANTPKVLMDGHAGNLIYLPLDKVLQASGAKSSSAASAQSDAGASPAQPAAPALDSNGMAFDARSRDNLRNRDREAR